MRTSYRAGYALAFDELDETVCLVWVVQDHSQKHTNYEIGL